MPGYLKDAIAATDRLDRGVIRNLIADGDDRGLVVALWLEGAFAGDEKTAAEKFELAERVAAGEVGFEELSALRLAYLSHYTRLTH